MAVPFLGEIKIWAFPWAPKGWALCNGVTLSIAQNSALFSLLGTQFGGNGSSTFNLPDLRGRVPAGSVVGSGPPPGGLSSYTTGAVAGVETVTLMSNNFPQHNHIVQGVATKATTPSGAGAMAANTGPVNTALSTAYQIYAGSWSPGAVLNNATVSYDGGGTPHENMQPFAVVNFAIAMNGVYPSRN